MLTTIVLFLVGLAFVAIGAAKLFGAAPLKTAFADLNLPQWLRYPLGALEVLGGFGFIAGAFLPPLAFFAAVPLLVITLGAIGVHVLRPPFTAALPAVVLSLGLGLGVYLQPVGLQIVSLPAHDDLPVNLLEAELLAEFEPGMFLESVTVLPDGELAIAGTHGVNFMTFDLSQAQGQILRWSEDGSMTSMLDLPTGLVAGVSALTPDGTLYVTATGHAPGVWFIAPNGTSGLFAEAPEGISSLNGLTLGPDGQLYVAADQEGQVLRLDLSTSSFEAVISDERLAPRPFVALAPGINGLEFRGQDLIMAVSDSGMVYSAPLRADGALGDLVEIASGIPGDDIAIAEDGTAYVTTHPFNTIVEVSTDGARTVVADDDSFATGSTDVAMSADGNALYMVTDGGAFTGTANAVGQLVRLSLDR